MGISTILTRGAQKCEITGLYFNCERFQAYQRSERSLVVVQLYISSSDEAADVFIVFRTKAQEKTHFSAVRSVFGHSHSPLTCSKCGVALTGINEAQHS